jgi:hypothetical protein
MKTLKPLFVIIFTLSLLSLSLSEQRNLSTPLSRLWGHWVDVEEDTQYYFAKTTKADEAGSFIFVSPDKAKFVKNYKKAIAKGEGKERELTPEELAMLEWAAGKADYSLYKVLGQEPSGKEVLIRNFRKDTEQYVDYECLIEKNGNTMEMRFFVGARPDPRKPEDKIMHLKYVDSKTTPED